MSSQAISSVNIQSDLSIDNQSDADEPPQVKKDCLIRLFKFVQYPEPLFPTEMY